MQGESALTGDYGGALLRPLRRSELPHVFHLHPLDLHISSRYLIHGLVVLVALLVASSAFVGRGQRGGQPFVYWQLPLRSQSELAETNYLREPPLPFTIGSPLESVSTRDQVELQSLALLRGRSQPRAQPQGGWEADPSPTDVRLLRSLQRLPTATVPFVYRVVEGDTGRSLAERFGITLDTLISVNNLENADLLALGQELLIWPTSGVLHQVEEGDTLEGLAKKHGVTVEAITDYQGNELTPAGAASLIGASTYILRPGQKLFLPGGVLPADHPAFVAAQKARASSWVPRPQGSGVASGSFVWPTYGPIFTYFSGWHPGIDVSPSYGTPIYASDGGVVVEQQWLDYSYGWYLTIDHQNGYTTQYSHLGEFVAGLGDRVSQGQIIGYVGNTGNSSGPHLDFRIRYQGKEVDPLSLLP